MSVIKIHAPVYWREKRVAPKKRTNNWETLVAFAHNAVKSESPLFKLSLAAELVLFLPLLILLIFGFHTPVNIMTAVIVVFSANFIGGMTGSGMRAITSIFALCLLNLVMLAMLVV